MKLQFIIKLFPPSLLCLSIFIISKKQLRLCVRGEIHFSTFREDAFADCLTLYEKL